MNPFSYLSIGLGAVTLVLGGMLYINNLRLDSCNTKLGAAQQQLAALEDKLDQQNRAVDDLHKKSLEAQKKAKAALGEARKRSETLGGERDRLKSQMAQKPTTSCPAGEAVSKIRQGLK